MGTIIRIYRRSSFAAASIWILLGVMTAGSFVMNRIGLMINLVIGTIFCLIGLYLLVRAKAALRLGMAICEARDSAQHRNMSLRMTRLFAWDLLLVCISLLVGIVLLSAATYRVFFERLAVFG